MDFSLPGSSVHGISQAKILDWVAFSSPRESSQFREKERGRPEQEKEEEGCSCSLMQEAGRAGVGVRPSVDSTGLTFTTTLPAFPRGTGPNPTAPAPLPLHHECWRWLAHLMMPLTAPKKPFC